MRSYSAMLPAWLRPQLGAVARAVRHYKSRLLAGYLGNNVVAILTDTRNGELLVDPADMVVGRALMQDGEYGTRELGLIGSLTNSSSKVLIVGSHVGALAIPISRNVREVIAVEANPKTFGLLVSNILLNGRQNVEAIQLAASDSKAPIQFVANKANSGGSKRMPVEKLRDYFYDNPEVITVAANRLDDVVAEKIDLVLMDIEGSEYFALRGMPRILSSTKHLVVEFLPHHISSVAGVSVDQFVAEIEPHFDELWIPSTKRRVGKADFLPELSSMFDAGASDDGIVFSKFDASGQA